MATLQPVRGTHDLLPADMRRHRAVIETAREIAERYGFDEMATPIFEFTEVFSRTLGDTSDIVSKEMYSFERSNDRLTLRPEGTAGVARAFISNGLAQQVPFKVFYAGPMFRYERPQKGRQRQFHQIGVELIGVDSPKADIDVLAAGHHILTALGLGDSVTLEVNTLGDTESRAVYRQALVAYLTPYMFDLSEDSRVRLERNPLRILDSKDPTDRKIIAEAPIFTDSLNYVSQKFFEEVLAGLDSLGIRHVVNPRLVRGMDYYCHTAFEFVTDKLGAQGTVMAGGRYDGLIPSMGGPVAPGIGWAAGVERLVELAGQEIARRRPVALIPLGDAAEAAALTIGQTLRHAGYGVDVRYSGNIKQRMKRADTVAATVAVIIGDDELAAGNATVRDLDSGEQTSVALVSLVDALAQYR